MVEDEEALIAALPFWRGGPRIRPLDGGITNRNFLVDDAQGRHVARVGGDVRHHFIVRDHEQRVSRAAAALGLSPAIRYASQGVTVLAFVEGRTLTPEDVATPLRLEAIVRLVRTVHRRLGNAVRGPLLAFWPFQVVRAYAADLKEAGLDAQDAVRVDGMLAVLEPLEAQVRPVDMVFGHNDLLAANLIEDEHRLWLLDYDYAGWNGAFFDLGALASNNGLTPELAEAMLELYLDRPADERDRRALSAMQVTAAMRETLWSMASERHSKIAFDYAAYTAENRLRYQAALAMHQERYGL
jgi:thiamine kinase-like enzyme